jgi:carbonic anhydrase
MEFFTNDVIRGLLANSLETAAFGQEGFYDVGKGPGSHAGDPKGAPGSRALFAR